LRQAEATARALVVGSGLGVLLAAANVYCGLKTGFIDGGSITASLLGSALLGLIGRRTGSPLEVNIVQTVAASAAVMSFSVGVSAAVPALALSGREVAPGVLLFWGLAVAVLGILTGAWLRPRLIDAAALPFPTGQATAAVVAAVTADPGARRGRLWSLGLMLLAAAVFTWLRDGSPQLIPGTFVPPLAIGGLAAGALTLGVSTSPLLLSTGVLVGSRAAASMVLGAVLAWAVLGPAAVRAGLVPQAGYAALVPVLLWPGLALLVGSALTTLVLALPAIFRAAGDLRAILRRDADASAPGLGSPLLAAAVLLSVITVAVLGSSTFGLSPALLLALLPLALLLSAASARAAGETDQAPVGQVGAVVQLGLGKAGVVPSLAGGALVTGMATQTAQMLWALKSGQRLGASPRAQVAAQLLGALVGAVVVVPVYALVRAAYPLGSEMMPAPSALAWKATSEAAQGAIPFAQPLVLQATVLAAVAGVLLTVLERRGWRWLPAPAAMGVAFVLPAFASVTILAGALLFAALVRARPAFCDNHGPSLAAGGIAGESIMGLVLAAAAVLGAS
jgi:putative OPT family oligopeptide transporter